MHRQFNIRVDTIASKEDRYSKKLIVQLKIWYARLPPGKKRGRSSCADNVPRANSRKSAPLEDHPEEEEEEEEGARPEPAVDCDGAGGEGSVNERMFIYEF